MFLFSLITQFQLVRFDAEGKDNDDDNNEDDIKMNKTTASWHGWQQEQYGAMSIFILANVRYYS